MQFYKRFLKMYKVKILIHYELSDMIRFYNLWQILWDDDIRK